MSFEERKSKALTTIANLFVEELKSKVSQEIYEKYYLPLLKMVNKEIIPICETVIEKNAEKLEKRLIEIEQLEKTEEEKQFLFNSEINSYLNILAKAKITKQSFVIQKNAINFIKFSENKFSTNKKKRIKEEKLFSTIKEKYKI